MKTQAEEKAWIKPEVVEERRVSLELFEGSEAEGFFKYYVHNQDGERIGRLELNKDDFNVDGLIVADMSLFDTEDEAETEKDHTNKGYGVLLYMAAKKEHPNKTIRSGVFNEQSERLWESLVRKGLARVISQHGYKEYEML